MDHIINSFTEPTNASDAAALVDDLRSLQEHIKSIHDDLCSLAPINVPGLHLPQAKDELGAVIHTTENSANSILDACQILEDHLRTSAAEKSAAAEAALMQIYEACSFQDLTGQRLTKVRRILGMVEERLGSVLNKLGIAPDAPIEHSMSPQEVSDERALMNGPAMPGQGLAQDDINALFD